MVNYQFQRLSEIRQLAEIAAITILPERSATPYFFQIKIFILLQKMLSNLLAWTIKPQPFASSTAGVGADRIVSTYRMPRTRASCSAASSSVLGSVWPLLLCHQPVPGRAKAQHQTCPITVKEKSPSARSHIWALVWADFVAEFAL